MESETFWLVAAGDCLSGVLSVQCPGIPQRLLGSNLSPCFVCALSALPVSSFIPTDVESLASSDPRNCSIPTMIK